MNEIVKTKPETASAMADRMKDAVRIDPGLGAYQMADLSDALKFADAMSKGGVMVPPLLRDKPGVCLAVIMRAVHWGFDPYALAGEMYQARGDGPVGYQAKVFVAALRQVAGIQLQYEFQGEYVMRDVEAKSAHGKVISRRTAEGDRKVIASAKVDGVLLTYETPQICDITVKNSPLWNHDPDQQLCYYAARGWARRHRPDVMMGAKSVDEADYEAEQMKDVTPKSGFAQLAEQARAAAVDPKPEPEPEPETVTGEVMGDEEPEQEVSPYFTAGAISARDGLSRGECPKDASREDQDEWFAGFDSHAEAAE